jgi:integrase
MFILFKTGMRISEFTGLTVHDLDMENRTINIDHQLQKTGTLVYIDTTKTYAGTRVIPMQDDVYEAFERILARRPKMKVASGSGSYAGRNESDYDYNLRKRQQDENVNRILEKIKRGGYDSLTNEEKHELFKAGQRK